MPRPGRIRSAAVIELRRDACYHAMFFSRFPITLIIARLIHVFVIKVDNPTSLENVESKVTRSLFDIAMLFDVIPSVAR